MTFREALLMGSAAEFNRWTRAAVIWQAIAEPNRDDKERKEPYKVADVHPFLRNQRKDERLKMPALDALKMLMPKGGK